MCLAFYLYIEKNLSFSEQVFLPGNVLSLLELVQLLSPLKCLTSVFGMRTGVSTSLSPPDHFEVYPSKLNNS